jgi:hypothetical protein
MVEFNVRRDIPINAEPKRKEFTKRFWNLPRLDTQTMGIIIIRGTTSHEVVNLFSRQYYGAAQLFVVYMAMGPPTLK